MHRDRLADARARYNKIRRGVYIVLPLALLAWVIWGVSLQTPGSVLAEAVSRWTPNPIWLPAVAGLLSVLLLFFGLFSLILRSTMAQLRRSVDEIAQQLTETHQQAAAPRTP